MLKGKNILLGVTGGIAAYKAADICSRLVKNHANVDVIMTEHALNFITPNTFEALCHNKVVTDTFDRNHPWEVEHIALADKADCVIIAPATANIIGKLANGIADDMLTTTLMACECPKLIAPAMNTKMWNNPILQDNLKKLKHYGWTVIEPASGHLACGTEGAGKLEDPSVIVDWVINQAACEKDMKGLSVMVSAGPTCEDLDPVRFLTNRSSGKMGYSIASAAAARGAEVTLVSGPVNLPHPANVKVVNIRSAADMYEAITSRQKDTDIIIKAAAVADYRPATVADNKLKKKDDGSDLSLPLERTDDILKYLGKHKKKGQFLCGFSMETENMIENSRKKLEKKNLDLIAANNVKVEGAGFQGDTNVLTLISHDSEVELPLLSKWDAANRLLDEIMKLR
ncbi:phosphopantothenoylcysteine decarboxylase / phosphopantothenate--cysteine ligase [Oribacterium sp. KHPX15]|uniref:bifunctional phosphopantothenoylcysteine decarboxylase/phosphopantothenate--cysteine ligase CoaBC n=1 Tax=Oribacterium sp. KHPX15 TaxID=1855342 RepID=UPI00089CE875|nr:bifunctional phosphopantothenoylcysteine decarboxylase/phosphopantothenate--cysteine ligase CoaBC [Oribacterium sp. KHPX15]SEA32386.1 phosphopantothenoylcysteine decarboxylase / phosphopantothenate--cysteine ligase [Oribacterium sp. KHPX15]